MQAFTRHPSSLQVSTASTSRPLPRLAVLRPAPDARARQRRGPVAAPSSQVEAFVTAPVPSSSRAMEEEMALPLPPQESSQDDPTLHNPLQRQQRMSSSWFGALVEFEGVVVEDTHQAHVDAWLKTASSFGYPRPLGHLFRRIRGVRDEICVSRVFGWSQNPTTIKAVTDAKNKAYEELMGGRQAAEIMETRTLLELLRKNSIPVGLVTALPEKRVMESLKRLNLAQYFDAVVTAEDSGAPEVEFSYMIGGQKIARPPTRCALFGVSNNSVEAAHELGMKCVVVTGNSPVYNFVGADLVVRHLGQITFLNLKKLFGQEELVAPRLTPEDMQAAQDGGAPDPSRASFQGGTVGSLDAALYAEQGGDSFFDDDDFDDFEEEEEAYAEQHLRGGQLGGGSGLLRRSSSSRYN